MKRVLSRKGNYDISDRRENIGGSRAGGPVSRKMNRIYTRERLSALERGGRIWRLIAFLVFLAGLIACILLCLNVTTENAGRRQWAVVITAVLSGWIAISLHVLLAQPLKARAAHFRGILEYEETEMTGVLIEVGDRVFLPRSVTIRKVQVRIGEKDETLNILADQAGLLPEPGTAFLLNTVRSYITGIGASHE